MKDHRNFVASLRGAPQDVSLPVLTDLLAQGYDSTQWNTSPGAVDDICISKNGDVVPLADFISGLAHEAPMFEPPHGAHVGCVCTITVTGPGLPDVVVDYSGIV